MGSQLESYTKKQVDFINKKLLAAARLSARTEKEIHSLFTDNELNLVIETRGGSEVSNGISFKDRLIYQIGTVIAEEILTTKWNVNKQEILKKITKLTEYQAFTLIRVSNQQHSG